jgi:hypothetical protein
VVNRSRGVLEVYVGEVHIFVGETSVLECHCYHLELSCSVSLQSESFLAKVEDFMFFIEACEERGECVGV